MERLLTTFLRQPPVASAHGGAVDQLLFFVHALMVVLFVGWGIYFAYVLWRFRGSRTPKADPVGARTHVSSYLEVTVAVVEGVLLFAFALPMWSRIGVAENFPAPEDSTQVRVIGRQFNWVARYPGEDGMFGRADVRFVAGDNPLGLDPEDPHGKDDLVTETSEVVVPVDKPVIVYVSSLDVVHSFAVHAMRVTQDAVPGLSNPVWFTPTKVGEYTITCAQLCGNGHYSMRGTLKVLSAADYRQWQSSNSPLAADTGGYE